MTWLYTALLIAGFVVYIKTMANEYRTIPHALWLGAEGICLLKFIQAARNLSFPPSEGEIANFSIAVVGILSALLIVFLFLPGPKAGA